MEINRLDPRLVEGGSGSGGSGYVPTDSVALNKISQSGGLPTWNGSAWPGGSSSGGDMFKAVYDPDGDGKFAYAVLPAAGTVAGTYAAGDDSRFHTHTNATSLAKITESSGLPLWNGAAWPSAVPGAVTSLTFFNHIRVNEVSVQSLKLTGGIISALNGVNGSDTKNAIIGVRDARGTSGVGTAGFVNTTIGAVAHSSSVQAASEWAFTGVADNYSTNGGCGTVGVYGQSNNLASGVVGDAAGYGGIWGGCFEATDMTYGAELNRQVIGAEMDCFISGDNHSGTGALIVVGDSKLARTGSPSADKRAMRGILVLGDSGARWHIGAEIQSFCDEGLLVYQYGTYAYTGLKANQAVRLQGDYSTAFMNLQHGTAPKGIVIDNNCTISTGLAVDIGANHGYGVNGQQVVGARRPRWGYATAANITADNAGVGFYRFDPNTDFLYIADVVIPAADLATLKTFVALLYKWAGAEITDKRAHGLIGS